MNEDPQTNLNQEALEVLPQNKQKLNIVGLLKTKKSLLIICGFILLFILSSFLFFSPSQPTKTQPVKPKLSKIWEITLSFDQQTQKLSLKNITVKEGNVTSSNFGLSPYKLYVLDKNNKKLFQTDIHVTEQILYMIDTVPEGSPSATVEKLGSLENIVYAPYLKEAVKIAIYRDDKMILEISPPKNSSFNLIDKAFAQTNNVCANSLNFIFISDGYSSEATFNNHVQQVIAKFVSLYPYSENPKIMDFSRVIYNTQSLGCKYGTQLNSSCLKGAEIIARNITFAKYPELRGVDSDHLKFIILVDADPQAMSQGSILGVASGIGAPIGAFQTHKYLTKVSAHEILGHAAGYLHDRYIYSAGTQNSTQRTAVPESNCSANPSGASFWSQIPGTGVYPGCTSNYLYAPFPRDCQPADGGYTQTMMSKGGCTQVEKFDAVEELWIKNNVVSKYQVCDSSVIPTINPQLTGEPTVAPTNPPQTDYPLIFIKTRVDANGNGTHDSDENQGVADVKITITGPSPTTYTTDSSGDFYFPKINYGDYTFSAEYNGRLVLSQSFTLTTGQPGREIIVLFPQDTVVPTSAPTIIPTVAPTGGQGLTPIPTYFNKLRTPTPTPRVYKVGNCVPDPATCKSGSGSIQLCTLKCSVK